MFPSPGVCGLNPDTVFANNGLKLSKIAGFALSQVRSRSLALTCALGGAKNDQKIRRQRRGSQ